MISSTSMTTLISRVSKPVDHNLDNPNAKGEELTDLSGSFIAHSRQVSCCREYGLLLSRSLKVTFRNP